MNQHHLFPQALYLVRSLALAVLFAALAWMSAPARLANAGGGPTLYVKWNASGANNGSSWANAYTSVQAALDAAAGGGYQIWVAAGTYRPFRTFPPNASDSFQLHSNVSLYGGFAGTETQLDQRNWKTNLTSLNGHLYLGTVHYYAYHVVTGSGTNSTALLDGFTVIGGNANGSVGNDQNGGGMLNIAGSPTVRNVTFTGNYAKYSGGAMYNNTGSSPTLVAVNFSANSTNGWGGGLYNASSHPTLTYVNFTGNSATTWGGGMYNSISNPTLTNVTFSGNSSDSGGAMFNFNSNPTLSSVTVSGNTARAGGGILNSGSSPTFTNVNITGNSATDRGGGMYNFTGTPLLTNVTLSGNSAATGGAMYNDNCNPVIVNTIVWGNTASSGAGLYNSSSTPTISYSDIQGYFPSYPGIGNIALDPQFIRNANPGMSDYGNLRLRYSSPAIDAGSDAAIPGGITTDRDGNPRIMGARVDMGAYEALPVRLSLPLIVR